MYKKEFQFTEKQLFQNGIYKLKLQYCVLNGTKIQKVEKTPE